MTRPAVVVVADDLTGAADTAGQLVTAGHPTDVLLERGAESGNDLPVGGRGVAVDIDSRESGPADAAARAAAAFDVLMAVDEGAEPFLKIDSTLRGPIVASVRAAAIAVGARRIAASPAFPQRGRTVRLGEVHVDGNPLAGPRWSSLVDELRSEGFDVITDDVAGEGDLDRLVADARGTDREPVLWVGAAAMAAALGRALGPRSRHDLRATVRFRRCDDVIVIAGSSHLVTAQQIDALSGELAPGAVMSGDALRSGDLAAITSRARAADGLVLTGGATARAVLCALGVRRVAVGGEVEPGIPWGVEDVSGKLVVTKAGGFGDPQALCRAVAFLRSTLSA